MMPHAVRPPPPSFLPVPHPAQAVFANLPPAPHVPNYQCQPLNTSPSGNEYVRGRNIHRGSVGQHGTETPRRAPGGLGLPGPMNQNPSQASGAFPLPGHPAFKHGPFDPPRLSPAPQAGPRPHPHLTSPDLYVSNVPHDLPEVAIVDALRDCLPVRIQLIQPVKPEERLKPDAYYAWMPRAGTLHFSNLHSAEKALAILVAHPFMAQGGLIVSTHPPPSSPFQLPPAIPFTLPPVVARYLRPTQQVIPPPAADFKDAAAALSAQVPTLGELFDIIRPWGSLRQITVWFEEGLAPELGPPALSWGARVEFWYEDEARRFEHGFGSAGLLIKGWQIFVFGEQPYPPISPLALDTPNFSPAAQNVPRLFPRNGHPLAHLGNPPLNSANIDPEIIRQMGLPVFPTPDNVSSFAPGPFYGAPPTPHTPSADFQQVPWANHNISASGDMSRYQSFDRRASVPTGPNIVQLGLRRSMSNLHLGSIGHTRQRTWSITLTSSDEGGLIPSGIVADDGTVIHHGPGQNLRPSPLTGPGSLSSSGLVDYSNVFVKNLDPDINSFALDDIFSNVGRIVSAKVMRDDQGRSRGYGFVSFYSPSEAAHAIEIMNNTRVGSLQIAVTLHEPRRLRPEKQAERYAIQCGTAPAASPRRTSPTRNDKRLRHYSAPVISSKDTTSTDGIHLLSAESRKHALRKLVVGPVYRYARLNRMPAVHIDLVIKALVAHDLALLPHLVTPQQLDLKIAEVLTVLQEDPDFSISLDIPTILSNVPVNKPAPRIKSPPTRPTTLTDAELRNKLIIEITKIDPVDAEPVVDILWVQLQPSERTRAVEHRGFLAIRYGVAKRQLQRHRGAARYFAAKEETEATSTTSASDPSPPASQVTTNSTSTSLDASLPSLVEYIRLDDISLETLAARSATDIMAHLSSPLGSGILEKLGMTRPRSEEAGQLARWIMNVRDKPVLMRNVEISAMISKNLKVHSGKKFAQLKLAREMVVREDIEALCKLIAYPEVLDAKARMLQTGRA